LNPISFALVIHNHQPVDNKDEVIESIYRRSYLPFIKILGSHPEVRANLHYTGSLLDWLEINHPEFLGNVRELVARGQVEMIGGGYYEPILSVIPDEDSLGQISGLSHKISELFGVVPEGCWLAERAWEPQLPETLERSKMKYTLLDDVMLSLSGVDHSHCFKPYLVESRGRYTTIFPILRKLRRSVPYKSVDSIMRYLRDAARAGGSIAVYADDGEKFGAWPNSYERVYKEGWLESFLNALEKNHAWLNTVLLSDYRKESTGLTRTYLSTASYPELMDWSLPATSDILNAKGFWRLFLAKYPESARMYHKMLITSAAVHALKTKASDAMLRELWKGQCNDAYWHGVFGGLYLTILRRITYSHLIRAQSMVEEVKHGGTDFIEIERPNFDGSKELLVNTKTLGVLASPRYGGTLVELDYKPRCVNLFDTLARRKERYHNLVEDKIRPDKSGKKLRSIHSNLPAKERGLRNLLTYEPGPRFSFLDHILSKGLTLESFLTQKHEEFNFPHAAYDENSEAAAGLARITFRRSFSLDGISTRIEKQFELRERSSELAANWIIESSGGRNAYAFSPELNFGSLGDSAFEKINSRTVLESNVRTTSLFYPEIGVGIHLDFGTRVDVWHIPINTVSKSESGYERTLQCISIMPRYDLDKALTANIRIKISNKTRPQSKPPADSLSC
jgi:alpha-amylase